MKRKKSKKSSSDDGNIPLLDEADLKESEPSTAESSFATFASGEEESTQEKISSKNKSDQICRVSEMRPSFKERIGTCEVHKSIGLPTDYTARVKAQKQSALEYQTHSVAAGAIEKQEESTDTLSGKGFQDLLKQSFNDFEEMDSPPKEVAYPYFPGESVSFETNAVANQDQPALEKLNFEQPILEIKENLPRQVTLNPDLQDQENNTLEYSFRRFCDGNEEERQPLLAQKASTTANKKQSKSQIKQTDSSVEIDSPNDSSDSSTDHNSSNATESDLTDTSSSSSNEEENTEDFTDTSSSSLSEEDEVKENQLKNIFLKLIFGYQSFIYLIARNPLLFKFFIWVSIEPHHWLSGEAIPLSKKLRTKALFIQNLFKGSDFFIHNIASPIFMGLLLHDVMIYLIKPEYRYGNIIPDILKGRANNLHTFTGEAGFNLVTDGLQYFLIPLVLIGSWLLVSAFYALLHNTPYLKNYPFQEHLDIQWNPISGFSKKDALSLVQIENALRWENDIERGLALDADRANRFVTFFKTLSKTLSISSLRLLPVWANLAASFNDKDFSAVYSARGLQINQKQYLSIRAEALGILRQQAIGKKPKNLWQLPLSVVYYVKANYLLWSLGKSKKFLAHAIFWIYPLWIFYVKARMVELIAFKLVDLIDFYQQQQACLAENKQWVFMGQTNSYACTYCGDWPFVSYRETFNAQGCMSALLSQITDPDLLAEYLKRFSYYVGVEEINLSVQNLSGWTVSQFQKVMIALSAVPSPIKILNLSRVIPAQPWMSSASIYALMAAFIKLQPQILDLTNQMLGDYIFSIFAPALLISHLTYIDLSANGLTDASAELFEKYTAINGQISVLKIGNNNIGDYGIAAIGNAFSHANLTALSLPNMAFTELVMPSLVALITSLSQLNVLDISSNLFSMSAATTISQMLPNSTVTSLMVRNAQIDDGLLVQMMQTVNATVLNAIDFSGNMITGLGLEWLSRQLIGSQVNQLSLSSNRLDYTLNMSRVLENLADTAVTSFDLSNNYLNANDLYGTQSQWAHINWYSLNFSFNALLDAGVSFIAAIIANCPSLRVLDLSHTRMAEQGALALMNVTNLTLSSLDISDNYLTWEVIKQLVIKMLNNSFFIGALNLSNTNIDSASVQLLAHVLPSSNLTSLDISYNPLDDHAAISIAQHLILPPYPVSLADVSINSDEKRALVAAVATSYLSQLHIHFSNIADAGARALCRILPWSNISIDNFSLQGNAINSEELNIHSCAFSGDGSLQAPHKENLLNFDSMTAPLLIFSAVLMLSIVCWIISYYRLQPKKNVSDVEPADRQSESYLSLVP